MTEPTDLLRALRLGKAEDEQLQPEECAEADPRALARKHLQQLCAELAEEKDHGLWTRWR